MDYKITIEVQSQGIDLASIGQGSYPAAEAGPGPVVEVSHPHVVDPHQKQDHLGFQVDHVIFHQDEVAISGGAVQPGIVDPELGKIPGQLLAQQIGPGLAVGEIEALGGAAADGEDGEVIGKVGGRRRPPETQAIAGADGGLGQFGGELLSIVKDISFIHRQDDPIRLEPHLKGRRDPQGEFQEDQGQDHPQEHQEKIFQKSVKVGH